MDQVAIKNSSKEGLYFKKGKIVEGVKAHTHKFVLQSLLNNYNDQSSMHTHNFAKWHQEAKLFQKILAHQQRFDIQQEKNNYSTINNWKISDTSQ